MTPQPLVTIKPWQQHQHDRWNDFLTLHAPENFLQSYAWGEFKQLLGKKVLRYGISQGKTLLGLAQIILESAPLLGRTAYLSRGPILAPEGEEYGEYLLSHLARQIARLGVTNFVVEPPLASSAPREQEKEPPLWFDRHWKKAKAAQPHRTLTLNIARDDESLLQSFKPKTRYNIRLAERKNVTITATSDKGDLPTFLRLLRETESRQNISLYSDDYFHTLFDVYSPSGKLTLLTATYEQTPVAALLLLFHGEVAYYLFGGTSNAHRDLMANYLLHFEAQKFSREKSARFYDFWGIALPEDENYEAWQGITRFKQGFGGEIVSYPEARQQVFKKTRYALYGLLKRIKG